MRDGHFFFLAAAESRAKNQPVNHIYPTTTHTPLAAFSAAIRFKEVVLLLLIHCLLLLPLFEGCLCLVLVL